MFTDSVHIHAVNIDWLSSDMILNDVLYSIIQKNGGIPPLTFKQFCVVMEMVGAPNKPCDDIDFEACSFPVPGNFDKFSLKPLDEMGRSPQNVNKTF